MPNFHFDIAEAIATIRKQSAANRANSAKSQGVQDVTDSLPFANFANTSAHGSELATFSNSLADSNSTPGKDVSGLATLASELASEKMRIDLGKHYQLADKIRRDWDNFCSKQENVTRGG